MNDLGITKEEARAAQTGGYIPLCKDFDAECVDVTCPTTCFLHAPERGRCPYLRSAIGGAVDGKGVPK